MNIRLPVLAALALWLTPHSATDAQSLSGSLSINDAPAQTHKHGVRHGYWRQWNGVVPLAPVQRYRRQPTVVVTGTSSGGPKGCTYQLADGGISPATWVAKSGATIAFRNGNADAHALHAVGNGDFESKPSRPRATRKVKLNAAGSWPIRDQAHSYVRGHLHVIDNLVACAEVTQSGEFQFGKLEPGSYVLHIFDGPVEAHKATVTVADDDITLKPIKISRGRK